MKSADSPQPSGPIGSGRYISWRSSWRWSWWLLWSSAEPPHTNSCDSDQDHTFTSDTWWWVISNDVMTQNLCSPGRPARRCAGWRSWLSCCWSPGRTELYGGCWRPPRAAPTRRCWTPAGARRSPTPAAWSLQVWSVWIPERDETHERMNPADLRDHWAPRRTDSASVHY